MTATISVIDAVLGVAAALDPVQELADVQNRGYFVDAINEFCGSPLGSPWCMNFVHYCGINALGASRWPLGRSGSCDVVLARAHRDGIVSETPTRGAVFLRINAQNRSDAQHAGFVTQLIPTAGWRTIEGNGALNGSREGKAVVTITRGHTTDRNRYLFVDWASLVR